MSKMLENLANADRDEILADMECANGPLLQA